MSRTPDRMVGIVGGSCSGKTTLERQLQGMFGEQLAVFPFDDMFVGLPALEGRVVDDWESPDLYRWDDYVRHLHDLKQGIPTTIVANSRESTDQGITTRDIVPRRFVVVAGFLALHDPEARVLFDDTIFIDLPEDELLRRREARANPDSPWDSDSYIYDKLLPGHRRFVLPQRAIVGHRVDGLQASQKLAQDVSAIIRNIA